MNKIKRPLRHDTRAASDLQRNDQHLTRGGIAEQRRPPAFQEYGADLLNLEDVKLMSLAERGLLATMRWTIWANDSLPRDPVHLARVLGLETQDVRAALTDRVLGFFKQAPDNPDRLICPELATQMRRLVERRDKQAEGGRDGARARKEKRNQAISNLSSTPLGSRQVSEKSRAEQSRALGKGADQDDQFVRDLEAADVQDALTREGARDAGAGSVSGEAVPGTSLPVGRAARIKPWIRS